MPLSLLILKVISKVTKLKMGIYHHILFIIGIKGMVNCQNSQEKGPPECNGARG